ALVGVVRERRAEMALELADRVRRLAAGHVDRRSLRLAVEGRGVALLRGEERVDVELDLADRRTSGRGGVAARVAERTGRARARRLERAADIGAGVVVLLLGGEDEQRVRAVDAVGRQALEEGGERGVVRSQVRLVARVAGSHGVARSRATRLAG